MFQLTSCPRLILCNLPCESTFSSFHALFTGHLTLNQKCFTWSVSRDQESMPRYTYWNKKSGKSGHYMQGFVVGSAGMYRTRFFWKHWRVLVHWKLNVDEKQWGVIDSENDWYLKEDHVSKSNERRRPFFILQSEKDILFSFEKLPYQ